MSKICGGDSILLNSLKGNISRRIGQVRRAARVLPIPILPLGGADMKDIVRTLL